jgi:uncharacterized membrane protein SpoIIM required for sporulation
MFDSKAGLWIEGALLLLGFFVVAPSIAAMIGYAAWKGKPKDFSRDTYWTAFVAAMAMSVFLIVYSQRMNADLRSWLHLVQLAVFGVGILLFGVAGGCMIGIFLYQRPPSERPPE